MKIVVNRLELLSSTTMDGLFVIGPMNVMLYHQFNRELKEKLIQLACENGLIEEQSSKVQVFIH